MGSLLSGTFSLRGITFRRQTEPAHPPHLPVDRARLACDSCMQKKAKERVKSGKPLKPEYKGPQPKPNRYLQQSCPLFARRRYRGVPGFRP